MTAKSPKGFFKGMASFIATLTAMADRMSRTVRTMLEDEPAGQPVPCPIHTAVEFGLRVPRRDRDASKKIFY